MGKQNKRLDNATITERRPGYYEIKVYYNDTYCFANLRCCKSNSISLIHCLKHIIDKCAKSLCHNLNRLTYFS